MCGSNFDLGANCEVLHNVHVMSRIRSHAAVAAAKTPADKLKANAKLAALEAEIVTGLKPKVIGRRSRR